MLRRLWNTARTRQRRRADGSRHRRHVLPSVEPLEARVLLDGGGVIWGNGSNLSVSFAADGTDIGGQPSSLHSTLDSIATEASWTESVLRALQTWAVHTNVDIGVVPDGGQAFGTSGRTQGDPRFGDVRVGAIPLSPDVMAVSVPRDLVVSGTWVGDVIFNSNADLRTVDDVFGVALHEVGHVLGLGHTDDPQSPMFRHGIPTSTVPTAQDIADLQVLYGTRQPDAYEYARSQSDAGVDATSGDGVTEPDVDDGVEDQEDDVIGEHDAETNESPGSQDEAEDTDEDVDGTDVDGTDDDQGQDEEGANEREGDSESSGDDVEAPGEEEDPDDGVKDAGEDQSQGGDEPDEIEKDSETSDDDVDVSDSDLEPPEGEAEAPEGERETPEGEAETPEGEAEAPNEDMERFDEGQGYDDINLDEGGGTLPPDLGAGEIESPETESDQEPESGEGETPEEEDQDDAHETEESGEPDDHDQANRTGPENDQIEHATELELLSASGADEGSAPSVILGDIDQPGDVDYYTLPVPSDYAGPLTLSLRTAGISVLTPGLSVLDDGGVVLGNVVSSSTSGDHLTLSLDSVASYEKLTLRVEGARNDVFGLGDYSLVSVFDDLNQVDRATIDSLERGEYSFLDHDEIRDFLETEDDDHPRFYDDAHTDDQFEVEFPEETAPGFAPFTRFELIGSIADASDVDHYKIQAPEAADLSVMTVYVTPLDTAALIPELAVFGPDRQPLVGQVLANGGGDYIVQFSNAAPDEQYTLRVSAADTLDRFQTGNYRLIVAFGQNRVNLDTFATGVITPETPQAAHVLHGAQSGLFYLALETAHASADDATTVMMDVQNSEHHSVFRLSSNPGQLRTAGTVLLAPGSYLVQIVGLDAEPDSLATTPYSIRGMVASDTIGISPSDPTQQPAFRCQDSPDTFCYPGGIRTTDRFVWQSPVELSTGSPQIDNPELTSLLFGDWWAGYWGLSEQNRVPTTSSDHYEAQPGAPMNVPAETGVLRNDTDPEGDPVTAVLGDDAQHGELQLLPSGAFTYRPNGEFIGTDSFTYIASDLHGQSEATRVTLQVPQAASPLVAFLGEITPSARLAEVLQVMIEFSRPVAGLAVSDLRLTRDAGDNLLDDRVTLESADQIHWTLANLGGLTELPGSYELTLAADEAEVADASGAGPATDTRISWTNVRRAGDADASGLFDRFDIVQVLRSGKYRTHIVATWAEGDWNGDGFFDQFDVAWALGTNEYR